MRVSIGILLGALCLSAASPASAYRLKTSDEGATLRWPAGEIQVDPSMRGDVQGIPDELATASVRNALASWHRHLPRSMRVGMAAEEAEPLATEHDRLNVVRWVVDADDPDREPEALATTYLTYSPSSGAIIDGDVVVNAVDYEWSAGDQPCDGVYDLDGALTHEFGHFFGLGHETEREDATMFPTAGRCETHKRQLSDDDVAGLLALYDGVVPPEPPGGLACSAGGGLGGLVPIALAIGLLGLRRRWSTAVVLVAALAQGASATTLEELSIGEMSDASALVVRARVIDQQVVVDRRGRIYTDSLLRVDECWRADGCPEVVIVRQLGGETADRGLAVSGVTPLQSGDELVLFLRGRDARRYRPVAMAQGVFRFDGGTLVRDLRELHLIRGQTGRQGTRERWSPAALRARVRSVSTE